MRKTDRQVLEDWMSRNRGRWVDVIMFGWVFGGRHGESPQTPTSFEVDGDRFTIRFRTTERLDVVSPSRITCGAYDCLVIPKAGEVCFGWHYYGRPQLPENWCVDTYRPEDGGVRLTRTGPLMPGSKLLPRDSEPAVQLL